MTRWKVKLDSPSTPTIRLSTLIANKLFNIFFALSNSPFRIPPLISPVTPCSSAQIRLAALAAPSGRIDIEIPNNPLSVYMVWEAKEFSIM